jgi:hypothetical protein
MLLQLSAKVQFDVEAIKGVAKPILEKPLTTETRAYAEHLTFQLHNVWEQFIRNFVLESATGNVFDKGGRLKSGIPHKYRTREASSAFLISQYRNRPYEPNWTVPFEAIQAAEKLKLSNLAKFTATIGSTPWTLDELRFTRNFFAHRSKRAALALKQLNWFAPSQDLSVETILVPYVSGGIHRFESWCEEIKLMSKIIL